MAKALLGHMVGTDPRLSRETLLMRRRITDLEALVASLQQENDELSAALHERHPVVAPETPEQLLEPALH